MTQNSLTIIGAGLAGYTLVREIRRLDKEIPITVITSDSGNYYSKPQLSNALTNHKSPEQLVLISAEKFSTQFNITLVPNTTLESLENIQSSKIIFATGAKAVTISCQEQEIFSVNNLKDYQYFRKVLDKKEKLQKNITIIGAGLVGCEFANDLMNVDYNVTIIAPESYPLARLVPEEVGLALKKVFKEKGANWRLGEFFNPLDSFTSQESGVLLSAIGLKPETALAQSAGIKTNCGILVDQYLQTNQKNIYALGDCMEFNGKLLPYIAPIAIAARALAKTLLDEPTPVIYPPMPIYIKTPAYPIVVLQADDPEGEWRIEKSNDAQQSVRALLYAKNKLKGFALGGAFTSEAVDWVSCVKN